ncbi:hypothetical protein [Pedobacter ginsengisoli]|uniref:hypothetical protein n=1 Tax=Pedobacter ginsengisoli TaxID=363852 RepID=UPI00254E9C12|nr:hypothetical protein [Pedobacter ginsengisoli]
MKILNINLGSAAVRNIPHGGFLLGLLLLLWPLMQRAVRFNDATVGYIDPNIWLLILLSFIVFLMMVGVVWWLLQRYWVIFGLPTARNMVSQFNGLELWQQLGYFYLWFALLLMAGVGCLIAIC